MRLPSPPEVFHLDPNMASRIYTDVGVNYRDVLMHPKVSSVLLELTLESEAKDLYTGKRSVLQNAVQAAVAKNLRPRGVIVEAVLLKDMILPKLLSQSIE